ncbi:unnamed protein product, partial [Mesorhabditis spiculigera]
MWARVALMCGLLPMAAMALTCFDCFDTGPDHKECTTLRNCTGKACMIYDAGDGKKLTAFCIMATKNEENKKSGCWMEADGVGKHCICHEDFCNRLGQPQDDSKPGIAGAAMLKANPLVDYDDDNDGVAPAPKNVLFPTAEAADPQTAGEEDDDLVPINFEDYENKEQIDDKSSTEQRRLQTNEIGDVEATTRDVSSGYRPPKCLLLFLTMATSWARLFAGL